MNVNAGITADPILFPEERMVFGPLGMKVWCPTGIEVPMTEEVQRANVPGYDLMQAKPPLDVAVSEGVKPFVPPPVKPTKPEEGETPAKPSVPPDKEIPPADPNYDFEWNEDTKKWDPVPKEGSPDDIPPYEEGYIWIKTGDRWEKYRNNSEPGSGQERKVDDSVVPKPDTYPAGTQKGDGDWVGSINAEGEFKWLWTPRPLLPTTVPEDKRSEYFKQDGTRGAGVWVYVPPETIVRKGQVYIRPAQTLFLSKEFYGYSKPDTMSDEHMTFVMRDPETGNPKFSLSGTALSNLMRSKDWTVQYTNKTSTGETTHEWTDDYALLPDEERYAYLRSEAAKKPRISWEKAKQILEDEARRGMGTNTPGMTGIFGIVWSVAEIKQRAMDQGKTVQEVLNDLSKQQQKVDDIPAGDVNFWEHLAVMGTAGLALLNDDLRTRFTNNVNRWALQNGIDINTLNTENRSFVDIAGTFAKLTWGAISGAGISEDDTWGQMGAKIVRNAVLLQAIFGPAVGVTEAALSVPLNVTIDIATSILDEVVTWQADGKSTFDKLRDMIVAVSHGAIAGPASVVGRLGARVGVQYALREVTKRIASFMEGNAGQAIRRFVNKIVEKITKSNLTSLAKARLLRFLGFSSRLSSQYAMLPQEVLSVADEAAQALSRNVQRNATRTSSSLWNRMSARARELWSRFSNRGGYQALATDETMLSRTTAANRIAGAYRQARTNPAYLQQVQQGVLRKAIRRDISKEAAQVGRRWAGRARDKARWGKYDEMAQGWRAEAMRIRNTIGFDY